MVGLTVCPRCVTWCCQAEARQEVIFSGPWYNPEGPKESWHLVLYLLRSAVLWQSHLDCRCRRWKMQSWFPEQHYTLVLSPIFTLLGHFISLKILFQLLLDQSTGQDISSHPKLLCCSGAEQLQRQMCLSCLRAALPSY